jgi:hypothetical protein
MLISQQMPKEVVYNIDDFINDDDKLILRILKELPTRPLLTGIKVGKKNTEFFNSIVGFEKMKSFYSERKEFNKNSTNTRLDRNELTSPTANTKTTEEAFNTFMQSFENSQESDEIWTVFTGTIHYLHSIFSFEKSMSIALFRKYNPKEITQTRMILDSQALEH